VDPFSHAAFGRTLAALQTPRTRGRGTILAVVLGALAPDVDAVLMPVGWDIYLRFHETGTHSLLGSLGIACLTALVVRLAVRDSRYWPLVVAAWAGALSHLTLDLLSGARVQLGWPLTDGRINLPLVAMAEPVLVAIFLAGSIVLLVLRKSPPKRQRLAAIAVLALLCLFLDLKAVLLSRALSSLDGRSEQVVDRIVEARWASLTEWYVYERTTDALQERLVRVGGAPVLLLAWPIVAEPALVTSSRSLSTVRNFLRVHELAFAVQLPDPTGGTDVLWSDIRFCWKPDGPTAATPPRSALMTGAAGIACALWFGGTFDESGRVIRQRVQVGGWNQTRAP
jgi:membrane-bound metal-dependent hydrolase YbcI (DUF457 family)